LREHGMLETLSIGIYLYALITHYLCAVDRVVV
jgi:hypothetical protein